MRCGRSSRSGRASDELRPACRRDREPYRAVLRAVAASLRETRAVIERWLGRTGRAGTGAPAFAGQVGPHCCRSTRAGCARHSTCATVHCWRPATTQLHPGRLLDLRRRLTAFGLVLARLDVRQDAGVHDQAMDAVVRAAAADGRWSEWDEEQRYRFLSRAWPRTGYGCRLPSRARRGDRVPEVFETFRTIARIPASSLGAYVITMASRASDVLAVLALQRAAGVRVPAARRAALRDRPRPARTPATMLRQLLAVPEYRAAIGGRQEVMVGYSDSSKDIGRFAAGWLLYRAQEDIVAACAEAGVALTVFHGRGGSRRPRRRPDAPRDPGAAARRGERLRCASPSRAR